MPVIHEKVVRSADGALEILVADVEIEKAVIGPLEVDQIRRNFRANACCGGISPLRRTG